MHLTAKHSQCTNLFQNNYNVFVKAWHLMAEKTVFGHTASPPHLTQLIFVQLPPPQRMLKVCFFFLPLINPVFQLKLQTACFC